MILSLRLSDAGAIEQNNLRTIRSDGGTTLRQVAAGIEIVRDDVVVLVPWPSIGSVTYEAEPQGKPTQPEPKSEKKRPKRATKRAGAAARSTEDPRR